jgi:hypothetical protein
MLVVNQSLAVEDVISSFAPSHPVMLHATEEQKKAFQPSLRHQNNFSNNNNKKNLQSILKNKNLA